MNLDELYAKLVIKKGINLKKGEEVFINSSVETADFARKLCACAYENGAKKVIVNYTDEQITLIKLMHEDKETLEKIDAWQIAQKDYIPDNRCAYINILSSNPDAYSNADGEKLTALSRAQRLAYKKFYDSSKGDKFKWNLIGYPSKKWADKVVGESEDSVEKLKELIYKTMRLDTPDPLAAWTEHGQNLKKIYKYLTCMQFDSFHYTNSLGTNLTVKMPENHVFNGGGDETEDGRGFIANMPTEEVFSAPHKYGVNGTVYSSMPLVHNGKIVKDFYFTFKDGKVVDYGAKEGKEVLTDIITTDEGASYLGEIAFVGYDTPIRKLNTLFYNTLFDENASCHFALGSAYVSCVKGASEMSREEQDKAGINYSAEHVDFMVGTADLDIVAYTKDGEKVQIFKDGNFVI